MRCRRLSVVAFAALTVLGCKPLVDPDQGRYVCVTDADCGAEFECKQQSAGGGRCFKLGTCGVETCNGKDDDCNGAIDDNASPGEACTASVPGVCAAGRVSCSDAGSSCVSLVMPSAELCNGLDDDCDGMTDEPFMLQTDALNCGVCGRACPSGTLCQLGACRETNCADGLDNDADAGIDCADPACQQRPCFSTADAGYVCGKFPEPLDGGTDAGESDAGSADAGDTDGGTDGGRFFCFPTEQCDDGLDNDQDGLTDCADPECNNRSCVSGTVCTNGVCPGPG